MKWCIENRDEIISWFKEEKSELEDMIKSEKETEDNNEQKKTNDDSQEIEKKLQMELESLVANIEFFSSKFDLKSYISKRHKEEMNTILGVQGFLPIGTISQCGIYKCSHDITQED